MRPDAAVVIVNYRSAELVLECLAALPAAAGPLRLETVVVDNASGDGSVERLHDAPIDRLIARADNGGFAVGVNAGFAATEAPYVVVINPDARPHPGSIARLVAHLEANPACGLAAPRLRNADGTPQPSAYRRFPGLGIQLAELSVPIGYAQLLAPRLDVHRIAPTEFATGRRVAHVYGACMAIRRRAFDAVGPFDEGFFLYLEETEWQRRAAKGGWTIELVADAEVTHLVRGGGDASIAPPPQYLRSAERYLAGLGWPRPVSRLALRLSVLGSWAFLEAVAAVKRDDLRRRRAAAWRRLALGGA
ncbi:MAG: hypothetical protein QOE86_3350 [Solirubrobacteraceae bacterium]|nr:hypothetical protein [Solirubrobacteraceae bacterium]